MRATAVFSRAAAIIALALVAGCGDGPTAPGIQPQITNITDAFSYQVSSIQNFSGTYNYTWQNTGTVAKITHASDAGATGTATLTVKDGDGTQVYTGELASSGQSLSAGGRRWGLDGHARVRELQQHAGEFRGVEAVRAGLHHGAPLGHAEITA